MKSALQGRRLAYLLRGLMLFGALVIAMLGIWLDRFVWPSRWHLCGILLAAILVLGLQPLFIAINFLLARASRPALLTHQPLKVAQALRMFDTEIDASLRGLLWANPFLWRRPAPIATSPNGAAALLFIHGYFCNRAVWHPLMKAAAARGYDVEAITVEPVFGSIDSAARQIGVAIADLLDRTGKQQLVLIAHSMGALVARRYLALTSAEQRTVMRLITLGAPHAGTLLARFGHSQNTRQMRRDSLWLSLLNTDPAQYPREQIVSIYSVHDDIVFPYPTSHLEGATNHCITGVGHVSLLYHPRVWQLIFDSIPPNESLGAPPGSPEVLLG